MSGSIRVASAGLRHGGGALPTAVSNSAARWTERRGLLFELRDSNGGLGTGEASPLPGYSSDTLEDCEDGLSRLDARAFEELALEHFGPFELRAWIAAHPLPPAARFAAETALLELAAKASDKPSASLLGSPTAPHPVAFAALLPGEDLVREAASALARGIRTLKIKVGGGDWDRELAALQALRQAVGPAVQLRLDANGGFPLAEAPARLMALVSLQPELRLELIEEPVPPGELARFALQFESPVALAADESLRMADQRPQLWQAFAKGRVAVAVLKPTVLGGALACLDLVGELLPFGVRFIVTHTFEGPVALAAARTLASVLPLATNGPQLAAGLDAHPGLAAWERA